MKPGVHFPGDGPQNATSTILFNACTTDQNNQHGIAVTGAAGNGPVQITACSLRRDGNANGAGSTTYAGIAVTGSSIPVVVTGTNVQAMEGDSVGGYGPHFGVSMTGSKLVSLVGGYFGCEAKGSPFSWDGTGSLQLGSGVLTGVNSNSGGFPGTTTTSAPPSPFGAPPPSANGFLAWTADPWVAPTSASAGVAKYLYLNAVYVQGPALTSKVWFQVGTAGSGATSGENFAGLYDSAGQLVASAAIDAAVSIGLHSFAWTSAAALQPGMYWIGVLFNASTMPQLYRSSSTLLVAMNANLGPAAYRACIAMNGTDYTALPSSITPSSNVQMVSANDAQPYWLAIS